jgi:hypothetical protein
VLPEPMQTGPKRRRRRRRSLQFHRNHSRKLGGSHYLESHLYKTETLLECEYGIFRLKITQATESVSEDMSIRNVRVLSRCNHTVQLLSLTAATFNWFSQSLLLLNLLLQYYGVTVQFYVETCSGMGRVA